MGKVVYSPRYNIGFFGFERLHPFDSRKYGRAWKILRADFGRRLRTMSVRPRRQSRRAELLTVHSPSYLDRLRDSAYVARALELPPVRQLPWRVVDWCVLRPMRWATMGSVVAAREARRHGFAVNLSGGYHHAKPEAGEGFSIYSDIAVATAAVRNDLPNETGRIVYVDLDAHQGNGVCHAFKHDRNFFIFDMYNSTIYPSYDQEARDRIDCDVRLTESCTEKEYLAELKQRLPGFVDSITQSENVALAFYNAGTDVFEGDPLGGLNLTARGIFERDLYVVAELRKRKIPTVMLLSGGYSSASYQLVASSVKELITRY